MFQRLLTFRTLCSKGCLGESVRFVRTYVRARFGTQGSKDSQRLERHVPKVNNVWNSPFQRLPTFGTLRSKGCKRLERYVPKVALGNRFVSFVRTHARGLEFKVPKVLNVWNVTFQRLLTFGTVRSKGSERLERCVPKVVWRNRCVSHAIASTSYHHHHSMFIMSRSSR